MIQARALSHPRLPPGLCNGHSWTFEPERCTRNIRRLICAANPACELTLVTTPLPTRQARAVLRALVDIATLTSTGAPIGGLEGVMM